jgi:hypothetical protein
MIIVIYKFRGRIFQSVDYWQTMLETYSDLDDKSHLGDQELLINFYSTVISAIPVTFLRSCTLSRLTVSSARRRLGPPGPWASSRTSPPPSPTTSRFSPSNPDPVFVKRLWSPEPEFLNLYGAQESIPRNQYRQAVYLAWRTSTTTLFLLSS